MRTAEFWELCKAAARAADRDDVPRLGAALAFYALFSLAPLLLVTTGVMGVVLGQKAARAEVVAHVRRLVGDAAARLTQQLLQQVALTASGIVTAILGVAMFLLGVTAVFAALQGALNTIWNVPMPQGQQVRRFFHRRTVAFFLVVGVGVLSLVGVVATAVLGAVAAVLERILPGGLLLWYGSDLVASLAGATAFFAMIYKILPDVALTWGDVWRGAVITAVFFVVGKILVGWYLSSAAVGSVYGAAGSIVVVLFWVYYSAQIVLLGAEFTQAYVRARGRSPVPPAP